MAPLPAQPLIHDHACDLPAFAGTSAIAQEIALPIDIAFSMRSKINGLVRQDIASGQIVFKV